MACYCSRDVNFEGRLIRVHLRYCQYRYAEVLSGQPLEFDLNDPGIPDHKIKGPLGELIELAHQQQGECPD